MKATLFFILVITLGFVASTPISNMDEAIAVETNRLYGYGLFYTLAFHRKFFQNTEYLACFFDILCSTVFALNVVFVNL